MKLRGRRGCLIWLPFLLFLLTAGPAGVIYSQPIVTTWEKLSGIAATPTPIPTPDYAAIVSNFRRAEEAAFATSLNDNSAEVLVTMPVFAVGEALVQVQTAVQQLRDRKQFQRVVIEDLNIVQPLLEFPNARLLTRERHRIQTFTRQPTGDVLVAEQYFDADVAYQLAFDGQRWRVEKAVIAKREGVPE
ncbi:MAG: hypothetical protein M9936_02585 [Caldilinea sp.]|nr:hypothetical protein [Caldilineaceae bacterium]MCO5208554.1 hypothetical protein [Caldilinea sp.]